ncbi:MAG: ABC transporter permease [Candidatus Omnitrophica bacterium]|nr:ABC transporter permease [Candidatus Omnitrophota bacterium]
MRWELFVSARYLLARQGEKFISLTGLISILGISVGVAALIVVIGVMSGFDNELENKIIGMNAHLSVVSDAPIEKITDPRVIAQADFVSGQAIISDTRQSLGVLIKGIDPVNEPRVTDLGDYLKSGRLPQEENETAVGSELAKKFNLGLGDTLSFLSLGVKKPIEVRVCGIFTSGMYEYDLNMVITNIKTAQGILGINEAISGVALKVTEPLKAEAIKRDIQRKLGYPRWVRTWMDMNINLFSALKLEKFVMFIILALIVIVACFNIASTLIMTVIEKTKDIGILKSIGASSAGIIKIFVFEGLLMGVSGALAGGLAGVWFARLISRYPLIRMFGLEEIYYFEKLPVRITQTDLFLVMSLAVLISLLATIYPAFRASRLNPVEALRYE